MDWKSTPFSKLQVLPKDGKPVINWDNRDDAWLDVAKGIRQACNEINSTLDKKDFLRKGFSIEKQPATIYHVAWSQDCRYLATGDDDHKIKIWDTNPEKLDSHLEEFRIAELVDVLEGHERRVKGLAWSPDDRRLASASADKKVLIWDIDWDVEEKQKPLKLMGHFDEVNCVAWASENRLLSGSDDNDVVCWNPKTGDRLFKFNHDHQRVLCLALSADVTLLATGAPDGIVRVWDWQARRCIYNLGPLSPHGGEIYSIAWANNKILASGSEDKKVVIWNLDNINEPRVLEGHNDRVLAISFSHNQKLLASQSADDTLRFWNVEKARPIDFFRFECSRRTDTGMTFDQKRPYLVSLGKQDHVFRTWEVAIDEMIQASLRRTPEDNTEWNKQ